MTTIAPAAPPRMVLLVKAQTYSHAAGYYLLNGRWHKLHADKPAPKGAPVAAHPHAAGQHVPAAHLTDAEWAQLQLPADNVNAGTFNKQIQKMQQMAESGHVTGILGMQYGVNTYGKKLAIIANHILDAYGVHHQVAPGQKAGEHEAVKTAPVAPKSIKDIFPPFDLPAPNLVTPPTVKEDLPVASSTGLVVPLFAEGKKTTGVVDYYQKAAQKVIDSAEAGDAEALAAMVKPEQKSWQGKTANSKALLALHAAAVEKVGAVMEASPPAPEPAPEPPLKQKLQAAADALANDPEHQQAVAIANAKLGSKVAQIPWDAQLLPDSNSNAKSHNGKVAQIKAMAEAGDLAGLESFKAGVNTYGKKQKALAALAAAALKESASPTAPPPAAEPAPVVEDAGPKDGDTKPGADGMLVFKDGHWHKQEPSQTWDELTGFEKNQIKEWLSYSAADKQTYSGLSEKAEKLWSSLTPDSKSRAKAKKKKPPKAKPQPVTEEMAQKVAGYLKSSEADEHLHAEGKAIFATLPAETQKALTLAALNDQKAEAKKAKTPPAPSPAAPLDPYAPTPMDGWAQTGPQGGTNPGGKFKDDQGVEWYCKFPKDADVAKSEVLAAQLYAAAGIVGQDAKLVTKGGKVGIASKWTTVSKASPAQLAKVDGVAGGFAVDAWLGNWDVVGMEYDNLQVGTDGKAVRVDAGGSLQYRAQGGKKAFGDNVTEIDSLRDAAINPQAAKVFGKISKADITASVSKVLGVSGAKIHALVQAYGPGDAAAKLALAETLIARKADLAAKYPKAKKEKKLKPFKPEKISQPPSFLNWGGGGKSGPSSKEFLNQANEAAVQAIYGAAQTGQLAAVEVLTAPTFNKETGEVTGQAPVLEHPSQHVKGYAQQAINEINYQLHPPKRFRFEGGHPLNSLNSSYPAHKGPLQSSAIQKVGKFILLGEPGTVTLDALALPKITYASGQLSQATYSTAAKAAIAQMPATQKQAVKSYTGSGYHEINSSLWAGNASGAAQSAGEALHTLGHEIKPGTVLSRKVSVSGQALDQILKSSGKVLQEPAIMSTSIRPSSWSGNVQFKLNVGPGVKGLWVGKGSTPSGGGLSNHAGEDEMVLPPNTRLLILSVKQSTGPDADGFGGGNIKHVIEAVILPSQASA